MINKKEDGQIQLIDQLFNNREYNIEHPTYDTELVFYNMVAEGKVEDIKNIYSRGSYCDENRGMLSKDRVQNARYHFIVTVSMTCRFCIEKGMNEQLAYGLSDVYIRRADQANTVEEIDILHEELVYDYAEKMRDIHNNKEIPKNLRKALDYIYNHLNDHIVITDIAEAIGVSESQVRRDFNRYLDKSPTRYINEQKIEFAKEKLEYTDVSYVDLANDLNFASHSHFIKVFKQYVGMTPAEYRNSRYRKHFDK